MHYEINVSYKGEHYFATAERSITTKKHCVELLLKFREAFPKAKGYEISVTRWEKVGYLINLTELLEP